jgi:hypothetical protein
MQKQQQRAQECSTGTAVATSSYHKHRCNQPADGTFEPAVSAGTGAEEAAISGTAVLTTQEWALKSVQQWTLYQQAQERAQVQKQQQSRVRQR